MRRNVNIAATGVHHVQRIHTGAHYIWTSVNDQVTWRGMRGEWNYASDAGRCRLL